MANLSSAAVAALVSEITGLKKTLQGTLIDQAEIGNRFDAATNGLLTPNGGLDTAKWEALAAPQQSGVEVQLSKLRQELIDLQEVYADEDGPPDEGSLMHKAYASNYLIIGLTLFALFGLVADLCIIRCQWNVATSGKTVVEEPAVKTSPADAPASDARSTSPRTRRSDTGTPSPSLSARPEPDAAQGGTPTPAALVSATPTVAISPSPAPGSQKTTGPNKPTEESVLFMVILLGALGGFLHLASSMANYVGNRQLLRSWAVYYFLIPFQGAALAPVVYLLLRVGVLNPANTPSGTASPTDSLNLIGIYAFAALTGLFSKQAIEMMADVFATIFKKVGAKDSLDKSKTEANKPAK